MSWDFFMFVLNWRKNKRNEIMEKVNKLDANKVLIFKNRRQLNKWYKNEFKQKINSEL